jgi:AcrR family transcriptional regulator
MRQIKLALGGTVPTRQAASGAAPKAPSPTARRILEAARRIVARDGFAKLTMQAIEEESGEYRALVHYHFGSKKGLVEAVVDSMMSDEDAQLRERLAKMPAGRKRVHGLIEGLQHISADWPGFRAFYEMLPVIMGDDVLRERLAQSYRASRLLDKDALATGVSGAATVDLDSLAALNVAVVEGLAVQYAADPEGFAHAKAFRVWEQLVQMYLAGADAEVSAGKSRRSQR